MSIYLYMEIKWILYENIVDAAMLREYKYVDEKGNINGMVF